MERAVKAEEAITKLLDGCDSSDLLERVIKGDFLSGREVGALRPKQGILINGRRAVVIDVGDKGKEVELIFAYGVKSFKGESYVTVRKQDSATPVQLYSREHTKQLSRGAINALQKKDPNKIVCVSCGFALPKYPGRYPCNCGNCGDKFGADVTESWKDMFVRTFFSAGELRFATKDDVTIDAVEDARIFNILALINEEDWPSNHPLLDFVEDYEGSLDELWKHVAKVVQLEVCLLDT